MGVRRLFQGRAKFPRGGGQEHATCLKTPTMILFSLKKVGFDAQIFEVNLQQFQSMFIRSKFPSLNNLNFIEKKVSLRLNSPMLDTNAWMLNIRCKTYRSLSQTKFYPPLQAYITGSYA